MKNLHNLFLAFFLLSGSPLMAQDALPERQADFTFAKEGEGIRFQPLMPPLVQKAGAPAAYYTYFWEFGDGAFSREEKPSHRYAQPGEHEVILDATAHYDNGKKAKKRKNKVPGERREALAGIALPDVFEEKSKQAIAMAANAMPRAEEELTLVISYRNNGFVTTDGRLHLFFNEKKYKTAHFDFLEARTHFGETADPLFSQTLPTHTLPVSGWTALSLRSSAGACISWQDNDATFSILQDMLNNARSAYREEKAWRFTGLEAGDKRNLFVSLAGTSGMLKDTSAFIHLEVVFAPDDPATAPERFELEIEIVASHDPNVIAVSDNRVSYRTLGSKNFDYKVQFQNNGEGSASTVELKVEIPDGLDMTRMRPIKWHPECPICPKTPTDRSCLDTASSKNGLIFTFRNIYLPGSRQEGVDDRDSTKGFVKYRIVADKDMPKRSFRSRAKITFDKNPPIYTNFTKTRFKTGISPGLKAGYHFAPDSGNTGYFFLGASLSPYKPWRIYPQIELLTGIKGRTDAPDQMFTSADTIVHPGALTRIIRTDSLVKGRQGHLSLELPVLLRKNFTGYFGAGVGGALQIFFENGERSTQTRTINSLVSPDKPEPVAADTILFAAVSSTYSETRTRFAAFADFTFGSVRAGPNLGIRAGAVLGRRKEMKPFVQVSLEMKL
ncbi:MAG: PKD domain-containing protein [Haliscomenobacteraceae bacterium CHB4]|nr:hypothetical protein [Saprospiraceae bacterium]MCE7923765.1 PKD domain-containing protein [Haliscomenobacteraceae bacterium CHB4]